MEFREWPKTHRLFRDVVVTEKLDGTNAAVIVAEAPEGYHMGSTVPADVVDFVSLNGKDYLIAAQSRKRLITPARDNYGFATWVYEHAYRLVSTLGEGYHYGEWWGAGIQRGYGLVNDDKRFSLFNTDRWAHLEFRTEVPGLGVVPTLYRGPFNEDAVADELADLRLNGSQAAPGFMNPEGIVVYHTAIRQCLKVTLDNDGHKGQVAA